MHGLRDKARSLALELYKQGTIGLKAACNLSGLTFFEFSRLIVEHGIEPSIPDELDEKMMAIVSTIDIEQVFPGKTVERLRKLVYPDETAR